jgi:hypothetical protein
LTSIPPFLVPSPPNFSNSVFVTIFFHSIHTFHVPKSWSSFHALDRFQQFHPVRGLESDFLVSTFLLGGTPAARQTRRNLRHLLSGP